LTGCNGLNGAQRLNVWNCLEETIGFGSLAKVLEPPSLVKEIKSDLEKAVRSYGQ
jgi:predicted DNA-binding transcriptional regulator YafY